MKTLGVMHPTDVPVNSDSVQQAVLVANTGQAFDVPTGGRYVVFGGNVDFLVRWGSTTASVPTTSSTGSSTNSEMNPLSRNIGSTASCTGYSIVSSVAGIVTASWFA